MLKFASLGSGSRGNATLVESDNTLLLIDCGYAVKTIEQRMQRLSRDPADITAVLLTHEHGDHCKGAGPLSRKYQLPVWSTRGTWIACQDNAFHESRLSHPGNRFTMGNIEVSPFAVPHDAREPCQFVFRHQHNRLGLLTDVGALTPHITDSLNGCNALMLEANYDPDMLTNGPYPPALQRRIRGAWGHLSNQQASSLLQQLDVSRLAHLIGMHVSEKNNLPELAENALREGLANTQSRISIANQEQGFGWIEMAGL